MDSLAHFTHRRGRAASTGRLAPPAGQTGQIQSATFSPDGRRIAAILNEGINFGEVRHGAIKVWDVGTGNEMLALPITEKIFGSPWTKSVYQIAFTPDGRSIIRYSPVGDSRAVARGETDAAVFVIDATPPK